MVFWHAPLYIWNRWFPAIPRPNSSRPTHHVMLMIVARLGANIFSSGCDFFAVEWLVSFAHPVILWGMVWKWRFMSASLRWHPLRWPLPCPLCAHYHEHCVPTKAPNRHHSRVVPEVRCPECGSFLFDIFRSPLFTDQPKMAVRDLSAKLVSTVWSSSLKISQK